MADSIGERIKRIRTMRGYSLRALATTADVPVSTLSALENGGRKGEGLTLKSAKRLALALGVSLDVLAGMYEKEEE